MGGLVRWDGFSAEPRRAEVAGVRASDRDRDTAVEALRDAFADGRLDRAEFERRSSAALAVTLLGELAPLLQDLEPSVPKRASVHDEAVRRYRRETRDARNGVIGIAVLTSGIWGATSIADGGPYFFWTIFPILGVGAGWVLQVVHRDRRLEELEERIARKRRRRDERRRED